jgi:hypothetical protein
MTLRIVSLSLSVSATVYVLQLCVQFPWNDSLRPGKQIRE